jgi:hypothetical protein
MKFSSLLPSGFQAALGAVNASKGTHQGGDAKKTGNLLGTTTKVTSSRPQHHSIVPTLDQDAHDIPQEFTAPLKKQMSDFRQVSYQMRREDYRERLSLESFGQSGPTANQALRNAHAGLMTEMEVQRGRLNVPLPDTISAKGVDIHEYANGLSIRMLANVVGSECDSLIGPPTNNTHATAMGVARDGLQALSQINLADAIRGQQPPQPVTPATRMAWNLAYRLAEAGPAGVDVLRQLTQTTPHAAHLSDETKESVDKHDKRMLRDYFRAAGQYAKENAVADVPMSLDPGSVYAKIDEVLTPSQTLSTAADQALAAAQAPAVDAHTPAAERAEVVQLALTAATDADAAQALPHVQAMTAAALQALTAAQVLPTVAQALVAAQTAALAPGAVAHTAARDLAAATAQAFAAIPAFTNSGKALQAVRSHVSESHTFINSNPAQGATFTATKHEHEWSLGTVRNRIFDTAREEELEQLVKDGAEDVQTALRNLASSAAPSAVEGMSKLSKRRREGVDVGGVTNMAALAQARAIEDGMLGTLVSQLDSALPQPPDGNGNIQLPQGAATHANLRNLVRRELSRELQNLPSMIQIAQGVPLGKHLEAIQQRLDAALAGHNMNGAPPDNRFPAAATLGDYVKALLKEQNEWADAPAAMAPGNGRSLIPEHFAQWAHDVGAPNNLQEPIHPAEPPPVQGTAEATWAPFRIANHLVRFGPDPLVAQELKRFRPDKQEVREALKESIGKVMRQRYPGDPDRQVEASKPAIEAGVNKLLEGRGRMKKAIVGGWGKTLKKVPDDKGFNWVKKIGGAISYQGDRLVNGNIGNQQGEIGQDLVKVTFKALGLEQHWPETAPVKAAVKEKFGRAHTDPRAQSVHAAINTAVTQADAAQATRYQTYIQAERNGTAPAGPFATPQETEEREIARQVVAQLLGADQNKLEAAAKNMQMAKTAAREIATNLLPAPIPHQSRADTETVLADLIYTRLQGITGEQVKAKLEAITRGGGAAYTAEQVMAGTLAAAISGRESDAVAAIRAAAPAATNREEEKQIGRDVDAAFKSALHEGRTDEFAKLMYKLVSKNELGSAVQYRTTKNRGFGLDNFVASWSRPVTVAIDVVDKVLPFGGTIAPRPGLAGKFKTEGRSMMIRTNAIGADLMYGKSKVREGHVGLGVTASIFGGGAAAGGVVGRLAAAVDVLFHGREVVVTQGVVLREDRAGGVRKDPETQEKMARAFVQGFVAPNIPSPDGTPYAVIADRHDNQSRLKRLLQENPMLSVGDFMHVEDAKDGSFGVGASGSVGIGPVNLRVLNATRSWSGKKMVEAYDDTGFVTTQRRVETTTSKREGALSAGAVRIGGSRDEGGATTNVIPGKILAGGDSYKRIQVERRHLIFTDGEMLGNSFMAVGYNHKDDWMAAMERGLHPLQPNLGTFVKETAQFLAEHNQKFSERGQSWMMDMALLRAEEDWHTLFDHNDPNYAANAGERERVLEATRRNLGEFLKHVDLKNSNQVLALCSDITPEAGKTITTLKTALETERDEAGKKQLEEKIERALKDPDSWAPINPVLNFLESRKKTESGFAGWLVGLGGVLRNTEYRRNSNAIADYR